MVTPPPTLWNEAEHVIQRITVGTCWICGSDTHKGPDCPYEEHDMRFHGFTETCQLAGRMIQKFQNHGRPVNWTFAATGDVEDDELVPHHEEPWYNCIHNNLRTPWANERIIRSRGRGQESSFPGARALKKLVAAGTQGRPEQQAIRSLKKMKTNRTSLQVDMQIHGHHVKAVIDSGATERSYTPDGWNEKGFLTNRRNVLISSAQLTARHSPTEREWSTSKHSSWTQERKCPRKELLSTSRTLVRIQSSSESTGLRETTRTSTGRSARFNKARPAKRTATAQENRGGNVDYRNQEARSQKGKQRAAICSGPRNSGAAIGSVPQNSRRILGREGEKRRSKSQKTEFQARNSTAGR